MQPTYYNRMLRTYLARHLPPEAAPYVTLVLWQRWEYVSKYWDQHQIYYHAVTAYSGYANVMCTFLDTDEVSKHSFTSVWQPCCTSSMQQVCAASRAEFLLRLNVYCATRAQYISWRKPAATIHQVREHQASERVQAHSARKTMLVLSY